MRMSRLEFNCNLVKVGNNIGVYDKIRWYYYDKNRLSNWVIYKL